MLIFKLNDKLKEYNLTRKEFSEITKIRSSTISAYCNNTYKHIVKEHLEIFCKYFNCNISDLLEYKEFK